MSSPLTDTFNSITYRKHDGSINSFFPNPSNVRHIANRLANAGALDVTVVTVTPNRVLFYSVPRKKRLAH